ncbi:MAG TPA: hypothetical protein VFW03_03560 [Gemmatimonadaceae bacterium]|nr:hypothetical protein [Gemmatimonadaceae bacterium]
MPIPGLLGAPGRRFAPRGPSRDPCGPAGTLWVEPGAVGRGRSAQAASSEQ